MRRRMRSGRRRPATITTRPRRTPKTAACRRARSRTCAGNPRRGSCPHFFDDDLVCASVGVHAGLLRGIEPFPTATLKPYDAGFVAGWIVERYQIDLVERRAGCARGDGCQGRRRCARSRSRATPIATSTCTRPYSRQTFKHILAPVWLMTYTFGAKSVPVRAEWRDRRHPGRISEESVEDRAHRSRDIHRCRDRDVPRWGTLTPPGWDAEGSGGVLVQDLPVFRPPVLR